MLKIHGHFLFSLLKLEGFGYYEGHYIWVFLPIRYRTRYYEEWMLLLTEPFDYSVCPVGDVF